MDRIVSVSLHYLLMHLELVLFIIALLLSIIIVSSRSRNGNNNRLRNINTFISFMMLLAIGFTGIWRFILYAFFPTTVAQFLGLVPSPFQLEVAAANLAIGVTGILCFHASKGFRIATTVVVTCFLWGSAASYIYHFIVNKPMLENQANVMYAWDLCMPIILIILMSLYHKNSRNVFHTSL